MSDLMGPRNDPADLGESVSYPTNEHEIRRHAGHVIPEHGTGELVTRHSSELNALNALSRYADKAIADGGSVDGGGFILYTTSNDGRYLYTYRIHKA